MSRTAKKQKSKTAERKLKNVNSVENTMLSQIIDSINTVHETTDRKLEEIATFCMDKKCNE